MYNIYITIIIISCILSGTEENISSNLNYKAAVVYQRSRQAPRYGYRFVFRSDQYALEEKNKYVHGMMNDVREGRKTTLYIGLLILISVCVYTGAKEFRKFIYIGFKYKYTCKARFIFHTKYAA